MTELNAHPVYLLGAVAHHLHLDAEFTYRHVGQHKGSVRVGHCTQVGADNSEPCAREHLAGFCVAHRAAERSDFLCGTLKAPKKSEYGECFIDQIH